MGEGQRERVRARGREREREKERENPKQALHCQPDVGLDVKKCEIMT